MAKDMKQLIREYLQAQKSGTSEDVARINQEARERGQQKKTEREEKKAVKPQVQAQAQTPVPVVPEIPAASVPEEKAVPDLQRIVQDIKEAARKRQTDTRVQAHQAQKEYETYRDSEENKAARVSEGVGKATSEAEYLSALGGGTESQKEKELKAKAENLRQKLLTEEDAAVMNRDMAMLEKWPAEDRRALETYIAESEQEKYGLAGELNFGKAMTNAGGLINKYGYKRVQEMAESLTRYRNAMMARKAEEAGQAAGDSTGGAIGHSLGSVAASTIGAISSPLTQLGDLGLRSGRYSTLDPNSVGTLPQKYAGAAREAVTERIVGEGDNALRKGAGYAYQGVMGAADTAARVIAAGGNPAIAAGMAASGSFGQTLSEASEQGASPVQAMGHAGVSATIEALTEKIPLDELMKTAKGGGKGAVQAIAAAIKQAGIEATTEEISLLGNLVSEAAILRDKSSYNQRIGDLVANGMSYQEAKKEADQAILQQAKQTAIVSGISGGVSSIGASVGANLSDRLGGRQQTETAAAETMPEAVIPEQAQKPAPQPEKLSMEQVLRGIAPKKKVPEAPMTEAQQRLDAAIKQTMGINEKTAPEGGETVKPSFDRSPTYEELAQKADLPIIDIGRNTEGKTYAQMKTEAIQKAAAEKWLDEPHVNSDTGLPIFLTDDTFTHSFSRLRADFGTDTILAVQHLPELIRDAVLTKVDLPKDPKKAESKVYTFLAAINGENGVEPVKLTVKEYIHQKGLNLPRNILNYFNRTKMEDKHSRLYDTKALEVVGIEHAEINKEFGASASAAESIELTEAKGTPNSTIKVTDLLGLVKGKAEKYIPKQAERPNNGIDADNAGQYAPQDGPEGNNFGSNTVGSAESIFHHEIRRSKTYDNTYANATDEDIWTVGEESEKQDPHVAEYDYISEKESLYNAQQRVGGYSAEEVQAEYDDLVQKEAWTGEDNDTAMLLLKHLMKNGDMDKFRALAKVQREQGTAGGQLIQSFAKYTRTPESAAANAVNTLEGYTASDVDSRCFRRHEGENRKIRFENWRKDVMSSVLEIGSEIESVAEGDTKRMQDIVRQLANFRRTTAWAGNSSKLTRAADRIVNKLDYATAKDIAVAQLSMIPDDFRKRSTDERVKTFRIQNMLSALTTVNRNLAGNATTGIMDALSDSTGGRMMDMIMSKFTGKRTVGNDVRYAKEYFTAAKDAADVAALCVELDIPMETDAAYSAGKTRSYSPNSGMVTRFFSAYEKYLKYSLEVTDKFFEGGTAGAVSRGLQNLGEKSGLTQAEISALAQRTGERRTYKEKRSLSKANTKLKEALNHIGTENFGAGDLLIPFAGTPGDVAQVGIDYSGGGLVEGFAEIISVIGDAKDGKKIDPYRQRKAATDFGRGMTGAGLIAMFTSLAACGIVGVHDDEDWDKSSLEQSLGLSGAQFNVDAALRAMKGESTEWREGDLTVSIDFLEPFNSQMYIGYLTAQEETIQDMLKACPQNAFRGVLQSMLDMPMMQTFSDVADIASSLTEVTEDGDYSAVYDAMGQMAGNSMTGFIPSWMRQTAQYIDPYYRDTTGENAMETAVNQFKAAIPYASQTLPKKYDGLGNEQIRYENPVEGFFDTFISPTDSSRIKGSEIADYLNELSLQTGDKAIYPEYKAPKSFKVNGQDVAVSGQKRETYQKTYGDNIAALYGELIKSTDFMALNDEQQTEAFREAKEYATQFAKAAVSDYDEVQQGTAKELADGIIRDMVSDRVADAMSDLDDAWEDGEKGNIAALDEAYKVFDSLDEKEQAEILEAVGGDTKKYLEMREAGIDTKKTTDLMYLLNGIKPQKGYSAVRDIQNYEAIADAKFLNEHQKDVVMKMYMPDYDPTAKQPNKTELKYDYARQEWGITAEDYMDAYRASIDNGKKDEKIAAWKALGFSDAEANNFYRLFDASGKNKIDVVQWYESQ